MKEKPRGEDVRAKNERAKRLKNLTTDKQETKDEQDIAGNFRRTKAGVAICPFFGWQSENIEGLGRQSENDVNLTFCSHPKNIDDCEGNCQPKTCPLLVTKTKDEKEATCVSPDFRMNVGCGECIQNCDERESK